MPDAKRGGLLSRFRVGRTTTGEWQEAPEVGLDDAAAAAALAREAATPFGYKRPAHELLEQFGGDSPDGRGRATAALTLVGIAADPPLTAVEPFQFVQLSRAVARPAPPTPAAAARRRPSILGRPSILEAPQAGPAQAASAQAGPPSAQAELLFSEPAPGSTPIEAPSGEPEPAPVPEPAESSSAEPAPEPASAEAHAADPAPTPPNPPTPPRRRGVQRAAELVVRHAPTGPLTRERRVAAGAIGLVALLVVMIGAVALRSVVGDGDDTARALRPAAEAVTTAATTPRAKPAPPRARAVAPVDVRLRIVPSEPSYVCVAEGLRGGVRGATLFEGMLTGPYTVRRARLVLRVGVATARVRVNGRPLRIESAPSAYALSPKGVRGLPGDQPVCGA